MDRATAIHNAMVVPKEAGPTDAAAFLTYLQHCLALTLKPGDLVVMDNLLAHKVAGVDTIIEGASALLLAVVFGRSQPHRERLRQAQRLDPQGRRTHR